MKEIGIGILGFGTVGAGVVDALQRNADVLAARVGLQLSLRAVADLEWSRNRGVEIAPALRQRDAVSVIDRPDVDVVVELIGGTTVARDLVRRALQKRKPVVTANKALLATYGEEIFSLAEKTGTEVFFGASVGGGIPLIRSVREGLVANRIRSIHGILNGTCNYILTRMEKDRMPFDQALAEAQSQGFAEANPALDIDGHDTAHKATILASMAYGFHVPLDRVHIEGIRGLSGSDIQYALDFGYRVKLLAVIKKTADERIEVRVHPTMVPLGHMLASVGGVFNAAMVQSDLAGSTLYYGRGAGREPTASTVVADIADAARNLSSNLGRRFPSFGAHGAGELLPMGLVETRYYLRLCLLDKPGVFAKISAVLGSQEISIASVLQKEVGGEHVPVVIVTHKAQEERINLALKEIVELKDVVGAPPVRIRIEE
jgi:homoserine dehydrogenase